MDPFFTTLIMYFIYFCIALAFWHYAVPNPVKKTLKKILKIFFNWLLFGRKPKNQNEPVKKQKPEGKKDFDTVLGNIIKKKKRELDKGKED